MSEAILYTNRKGLPVTTHSHSGGDTFRKCKALYKLGRIDGWTEKDKRASKEFGICIEEAIREYHEQGLEPTSGVEEFLRRWNKVREIPDLLYTEKEGSWEDLQVMGAHMMKLYAARLPYLPIKNPRFQLNFKKEVFPKTHLAGIKFTAYIDMLAEDASLDAQRLYDIKVMASRLDETPDIIKLDPQLRKYAWVTGIRHVGFLWFVKARLSIKKGDDVTLLMDWADLRAGSVVNVLKFNKEESTVTFMGSDGAQVISASAVTKVKLQFATATISDEDALEAGEEVGMEIAEIHMANEKNFWPKQPSIRFPNMKCQMCQMRGICLDNKELRDQLVVRAEPQTESDWLDEEAA